MIRTIGLISVASGDGVVAASLDSDGRDEIYPLAGVSVAYPDRLRWRILEATQNDLPITETLRLERELTEQHVAAVQLLLESHPPETEGAIAIGYSGHTIRHIPSEHLTQQIGDPWMLAERTKIPVISDFRRHDMAIGGQGAPLVAMFHWALMANEPRPALILDLGVVASVTWLSRENEIIAGDTGPGVGLLNEWVQVMAEIPDDFSGNIAMRGKIDNAIVREALEAPFFSRSLPKAADRNDFDAIDVSGLSAEDGAATLCAVTVGAFVDAVKKLPELPRKLWITGIGSRHPLLVQLLEARFPEVHNVSERGLDPVMLEAQCYGWLAVRHLRRLPITTPETTGCQQAQSGGFGTHAPLETTTHPSRLKTK